MAGRGRPSARRPDRGRRDGRSSATPKTAGNTQRSVAKRPPAAKKPDSSSGTNITARAVVLVGVALLLVGSYTSSIHAWWNQRQEIMTLQTQKAAAEDDIAELHDIERRWKDPAYVRQQARERFGWVMPGEVGYRVIGLDGELKGGLSSLESPPPAPRQGWAARMWGSVERAGDPIEINVPDADDPDEKILKTKKE